MELDGNRIHVRSLGVAVTRTEGVQLKDLPSCLTLKSLITPDICLQNAGRSCCDGRWPDRPRPMELERDAQSQADRAAAVDALLAKTADQTAKIVIACYVSRGDRQNLERVRINANREGAQPSEFSAATPCISVR